jgi:hypothetical protein
MGAPTIPAATVALACSSSLPDRAAGLDGPGSMGWTSTVVVKAVAPIVQVAPGIVAI